MSAATRPATLRTWHGEPALSLEASGIRVVILPHRGGKIASLVDEAGRQWLAQPPAGPLTPVAYGASFVGAEMCGWDEMAPTIVSAGLPDHGEVWAVPWGEFDGDGGAVELEVLGRALPYLLRRRVEITGVSQLRLSYCATAIAHPVDFLWAAHPQFRAPQGTTVELPAHVSQVIDVDNPVEPRLEPWAAGPVDPLAKLRDGESHKVWCQPEDAPSWCQLDRPDGGRLTISWDSSNVPYLGVWADRNQWSREPVVALEPSTGFYDDVDRARSLGRTMRLVPGAWTRWEIAVSIGLSPQETNTTNQ